jgi:hypothetical protein
MLTQYEATKLQRDMRHELEGTTHAVLKSVIGLLVVVLLAVLGSTLDLREDTGSQASARAAAAANGQ